MTPKFSQQMGTHSSDGALSRGLRYALAPADGRREKHYVLAPIQRLVPLTLGAVFGRRPFQFKSRLGCPPCLAVVAGTVSALNRAAPVSVANIHFASQPRRQAIADLSKVLHRPVSSVPVAYESNPNEEENGRVPNQRAELPENRGELPDVVR